MMRSAERVRALAERGAIDPEGAARLLDAIEKKPPRPLASQLVDPFATFSTARGIALATVIALASIAVGHTFGVRFDGFLDLHRQVSVSWRTAALDQVAAVLLPTLVFFAVTIVLARSAPSRLVDFFIVVGSARIALPFCAIPLAWLAPTSAGATSMSASLFAVLVIAIVALATHLTWLWHGFKNASGLSGARAVTAFVIGIALSESLSKLLLSLIG